MKFTYKIKEIKPVIGTTVYDAKEWTDIPNTYQEIGEMSLHKLIKKLDAKKFFLVSYVNKKSNYVDKIVFAGDYRCL